MPPKKGDKGPKVKKGARPAWMSEEMFMLSQNLPKLHEFWTGDVKDSSKGKAGAVPIPTITRTQAGLFILQLIFPSSKAGKERREECIKLGLVESSAKVLASQKAPDMVSAAQMLMVMADTFDQSRQVMIDSKPAVIPQLLAGLANQDSAPLKAAICGLLRVIATHDDTRPRLWRQLKEWDWSHLIACLSMQDLSQLGGRNAAHDAMTVLEAMCSAPEGEVGTLCCNHVVNAGGLQAIVKVLQTRISHPMARAAGVGVLNQIMRRAPAAVCEEVMGAHGGLQPIVGLLSLPTVPLKYKAHAAAVLLRFIMPDSLWKNPGMLPGGARPTTAAFATTSAAPTGSLDAAPASTSAEAAGAPSAAAAAAGQGPAPGVGAGTPRMDTLKGEVSHALEGAARGGPARGGTAPAGASRPGTVNSMQQEPAVPDDHFLDEATKADIAKRAALVAQGGAVTSLVMLCRGPEGPLPDVQATGAATDEEGKGGKAKGKAKKGGKKKKGKLEPGMAEAQTWASAVLRMISLDAEQRQAVVYAGAVRFLLPLLDSKIHPARWNARQTLINLSMSAALVPHLQLYKVPSYIHNSNVPARHFDRPFPPSGVLDDALQRIPAHLAGAVAAAQKDIQARGPTPAGVTLTPGSLRPPALKSGSKSSLLTPGAKAAGAAATLGTDVQPTQPLQS